MKRNCPKLEPSSVKSYGYLSKVALRALGKFSTKLESETKKMKGSSGSLLSWKTLQELNLCLTVQQVKILPSTCFTG